MSLAIQQTLECFTGIQCWRLSALRLTAIVTVHCNEASPVAREATFVKPLNAVMSRIWRQNVTIRRKCEQALFNKI
jgi:hypothetical protein